MIKFKGDYAVYKNSLKVEQPNRLLDNFFQHVNLVSDPITSLAWIGVGAGDTPVADSDDYLDQPITSEQVVVISELPAEIDQGVITAQWVVRATFTFNTFSGTIREVGTNFSNSDPNLIHSRAVLQTPVVVQLGDVVVIEYTLEMSAPVSDAGGSVDLDLGDGQVSSHTIIGRVDVPKKLTEYTNAGTPTVYSGDAVFGLAGEAVTASEQETVTKGNETSSPSEKTFTMIADAQGVLTGGIRCLSFAGTKFDFDPAIPKDALNSLNLDLTRAFAR